MAAKRIASKKRSVSQPRPSEWKKPGRTATVQRARERDPVSVGFGRAMRDVRLAAGMLQRDLAERSGYHMTFISMLEQGWRGPSLASVLSIAEAVGMSGAKLVNLYETKYAPKKKTRRSA